MPPFFRRKPTAPLTDSAARLVALRELAGFTTAAAAARAMQVNEVTYQHHENGRRAITIEAAVEYSRFFGVHPSAILFDAALRPVAPVLIVGAIEARAKVNLFQHPMQTVEPVPIASPHEYIAFTVTDAALYPAYARGDTIYCRDWQEHWTAATIHGMRAIVELDNGDTLLRWISISPAGLTLSWDGTQPIIDAHVRRLALVEFTRTAPSLGNHTRAAA